MPFRSIRYLAVLLFIAFGFLVQNINTVQASNGPSYFVRVPAEAVPAMAALNLSPLFEQDYETFRWLELSQSDYAVLANSSISFYNLPAAGEIRVPGYRFDPQVNGPPPLPAALQIEQIAEPGLHLVQFRGPIQSSWLTDLEARGLQLLQYYPSNTYLIWGLPEALRSIDDFIAVRWQGVFEPAYKLSGNLAGRTGRIQQVEILFFAAGEPKSTLLQLAALGARLIQSVPAQPDRQLYQAIVELDASRLVEVAQIPQVLWLGYLDPEPVLDDEVSDQITAGNYIAGVPFPGYQAALSDLGFDGSGVIWSITDTGVDYDHPDLNIVGGYTYPGAPAGDGPGDDCEFGGHGTHVAGIFGGDASAGYQDGNGYLYGLGVAPGAGIFAQNPICGDEWPPIGGWQELSKRAVLGGAVGSNNSWTSGEGTLNGYQLTERTHDLIARDANFDTGLTAEALIQVFSAGNSGSSGLTAPKEAKNIIVVANSLNYRVGDIDQIATSSSRGPTVDGRWAPILAAPGSQIASSRNDLGGICATPIPETANLYAFCSGSSMAAPHVSGGLALVTQWWRASHAGLDPSPAMAKALLVNAAVDMGDPDIPNIAEGWGRLNVAGVISSSLATVYFDQHYVLDNPGDTWFLAVQAVDPDQPLKVSLAWTDAAGAVEANPALVNDLDLLLQSDLTTYHGNHFEAGWSVPGGQPDPLNNLENVFIPLPGTNTWVIRVQAANLPGDGVPFSGDSTDQDFALVCYNCQTWPDFTLSGAPASQAVCAPQPADYQIHLDSILGYNDPVSLTLPSSPPGAGVTFNPNPVGPPGISDLTLKQWVNTPPGSYELVIVGAAATSTHTITLGLDLFTAFPNTVNLLQPDDGAEGQELRPAFSWQAAEQAITYTFELAADLSFSQLIYTAAVGTNSLRLPLDLDFETNYYWRVRAENVCGQGPYSDIYTFATKPFPTFLLVDDDGNRPDLQSVYTRTLEQLGIDYLVWDTQSGDQEPQFADLEAFEIILWYSAAAYGTQAGPALGSEADLTSWLSDGRCFVLSSQDYLSERGLSAFAQQQLGLASYREDYGQSHLVSGHGIMSDWPVQVLDYPFAAYADVITPTREAELLWLGNQGGAAIYRAGLDAKTVFLAFPFEAVPDLASRVAILAELVGWCQQPTGQLAGLVRDADYGIGVAGSLVTAESEVQIYTTQTDAQGAYTLTLPVGVYSVTAQAPFYITQTISGIQIVTNTLSVQDFDISYEAFAGFELNPTSLTRSGLPGELVTHTFTIYNTGSVPDRYTWVTHDYVWSTTPAGQTSLLAPGASEEIAVRVSVPENVLLAAPLPAGDSFTLTATSENYSGHVQHIFGSTYVGVQPGVLLSGDAFAIGSMAATVTHTLLITNTGNYTDTYQLQLLGVEWLSQAPQQVGPLGPGASTSFEVVVALPGSYPPVRDRIELAASSTWDELVTALAQIETRLDVNPQIVMFPSTQNRYGNPGEIVMHSVRFTNYGDTTDSYQFELSGNRWPTFIQASVGPLAPGEMVTVNVPVQVPFAPWPDQTGILSDTFRVRINSVIDPELVKYSYGTTQLQIAPAALLASQEAVWQIPPGTVFTGTLFLTNSAPDADRYHLTLEGGDWPVALVDARPLRLPAQQTQTVEIVVQSPEAQILVVPKDVFTLTARSGWNGKVVAQIRVPLTLDVSAGLLVDLPAARQVLVGSSLLQPVTLTNIGNYPDAYTITLESSWPAQLSPGSTGWLAVGDSSVVTLEVSLPLTALDQQVEFVSLFFQSAHEGQIQVKLLEITALWQKVHLPVLLR